MLKSAYCFAAVSVLLPALPLWAQASPAAPEPKSATMPAAQAAPHSAPEPTPVQTSEPIPPGDAPSPLPEAAPMTGVAGADTAAAAQLEPPASLPPPPPPPPTAAERSDFKLDMGGGMILFYTQPLHVPGGGSTKGNFEVFEAKLRLDAEFGIFGMHIVPIARDTKERAFFPGEVWVQEAYAFSKLGPVTIKVGKVFAQFGRFWDNSFTGNAQEYDGLKLDPNHGISIEGNLMPDQRMGMQFFAQYFLIDGTTNYSLPGRDTMSIDGAHRRNYLVGRVEPFVKVGDMTTLKLGLSGSYFEADIPGLPWQNVGRVAIDGTVMVQNFTAWAEYTHQFGNQLAMNPFMVAGGAPYNKADWAMIGGEYTYQRFTFRYNFNMGSYLPIDYKETRHIPGIAVALDDHLFVLLEWALAHSHIAGHAALLGNSLNLTIHGKV
jgi:hypothetical protein